MTRRIERFCAEVYSFYQKHGRKTLPWRLNTKPWGVLVSEFMLQQTQIDRVIPYWQRWLERWPLPEDLCGAPLEDALCEWNGLGYNRRGRALWECASRICGEYGGKVPKNPSELIGLPGIGPYSAGAIACFAYNVPSVFIETNIRAAVLHFFFAGVEDVRDEEIAGVLDKALNRENPRLWYWALMDYGAYIKKITPNPNRRSAHYARQSPFEGSFRQRRSLVLRMLLDKGPADAARLQRSTGIEGAEFFRVCAALEKDMLLECKDGLYQIASGGRNKSRQLAQR
ncbi:MAG: A/G-specific adenine glycosylase [Spirochaetaceae bacterium]|nr:A/G-specific adenine glycosylase [Spirochaetaceae bacterium]